MAAKETIDIDIKTTGDTSGAEAVEKSIFAIEDATKKAERDADVETAKGKLEARLAGVSGKVAGLVAQAKALAGPATAVYQTMTTVFSGVKSQFDAMAAAYPDFAEKNAQLGGAINALANPVATLKQAWVDTSAFILEKIDQIVLGGAIASVKSALDAKTMADNMAASYQAMVDRRLQQDARAVASLQSVLEMEEKLEKFKLASEDRIAKAKEAAAAAAEQRAGVSQGEQAVNAVARVIAQDTRAVDAAQQALDTADRNLADAIANQQAASRNERAKMDALVIQAQQAQAEASITLNEVITTGGVKILDAAAAKMKDVTDAAEAKFTQQAVDLKQKLEGIQAREGAATSAAVLQALKEVNKILADGKVTMDEARNLGNAFLSFRQSYEAATQVQQQNINGLIESVNNGNTVARAQAAQIASLLQAARSWQATSNGSF